MNRPNCVSELYGSDISLEDADKEAHRQLYEEFRAELGRTPQS